MWEWIKKLVEQPPLSTDLFPGVEKPTVTLAHMLVQEMLMNVRDARFNICDYLRNGAYVYSARFPSFEARVSYREQDWFGEKAGLVTGETSRYVLNSDNNFKFDADERKILDAGFLKFFALRKAWDDSKAETLRQEAALGVIEKAFKPKEQEKVSDGNVHEALRPPDSSGQAQSIIAPFKLQSIG